MDKYKNFSELKQHEKDSIDYEIQIRKGRSGIAVIAPHGGGIEPGTVDIADGVAGREHTFYCFKGIKKKGNTDLHITSDKFDEPHGIRIAEGSERVLAIHGCRDREEVIYVGGNDLELKGQLFYEIEKVGFVAEESMRPDLQGRKPGNICNRGRRGKGGQIEISESLREKMFDGLFHDAGKTKTSVFHSIVTAIPRALERFSPKTRDAEERGMRGHE